MTAMVQRILLLMSTTRLTVFIIQVLLNWQTLIIETFPLKFTTVQKLKLENAQVQRSEMLPLDACGALVKNNLGNWLHSLYID